VMGGQGREAEMTTHGIKSHLICNAKGEDCLAPAVVEWRWGDYFVWACEGHSGDIEAHEMQDVENEAYGDGYGSLDY